MLGLEQIADGFDQLQADAQRDVDDWMRRSAQSSGSTYGPDSWQTYGIATVASVGWALFTFSTNVAKGMLDTLRLGEGIKKGTLGGVAQDGIRILSVAGPVFKGARLLGLRGVATGGYAMSCGVTSNAAAMRLTGTRLAITLDELAQASKLPVSPKLASFPGLATVDQLVPTIRGMGGSIQMQPAIIGAKDVTQAALKTRGAVVFGVRWWAPGPGGIPQMAGGHIMTAFRDVLGRVMVADQFGVRPIEQMSEMVVNGVKQAASQFSIAPGAYILEDAALVRNVEALGAATGLREFPSLAVELVHIPGPVAKALDAGIREHLGRPPRDPSGTGHAGPGTQAAPSARQPLGPAATRLLAGVPKAGAVTPAALRATTGLTGSLFYDSVKELEAKGYITVTRFGQDELNITAIARR